METRHCEGCGQAMNLYREGARTCSAKCRKRVSRRTFPEAMTSRDRWIRRDADKRPLRVDGGMASSTDPTTWSAFGEAQKSARGAGAGYVLGDGVGAYDLDHCIEGGRLADWARDFIGSIPEPIIFTELSQSGQGVHIFIEAPEGPGRKIRDGRNIERYTSGRYIAVTGRPLL